MLPSVHSSEITTQASETESPQKIKIYSTLKELEIEEEDSDEEEIARNEYREALKQA